MVKTFRLGFADRSLGYRIPAGNRHAGAQLRGRLQKLGVYRKNGREHMRGCLVVPLFDEAGRVVQMYGRKVGHGKTAKHLYLPGPQRGVFNRAAFLASKKLILCEAILDALTFWCAGFRNVTTTYGTSGLTDEIREALRKHGTQEVAIAFDRDAAGEKAAEKVAAELLGMGIAAYRVQLPQGQDVNEFAKKAGDPRASLGEVLRAAVWLGKGKKKPSPMPPEPPEERESAEVATEEDRASKVDGSEGEVRAEPALPEEEPRPLAPEEPITNAAPALAGELQGPPVQLVSAPSSDPKDRIPDPAEPVPDPSPPPASKPPAPSPLEADPVALPAPAAPTPSPDPPPAAVDPPPPPPPPPASSPEPAPFVVPAPTVELHRRGEDLWMRRGDRTYRVRGLAKNLSYEVLKVHVMVLRDGAEHLPGPGFHDDLLDLRIHHPRRRFVQEAARVLGLEVETLERDMGQLLRALEAAQEAEIQRQLDPPEEEEVQMTEAEREEALALLRTPDLFGEILRDFERCGVVGEETNKLAGYVAAVSRKLDRPLAIVVQSNSAAGKSALMEAVLAFMPEEEQVTYSAMTGQSLYYMEEADLRHKILAVAEEEGAQRASYSLKLLQSEGVLSIASPGKDQATGRLRTETYRVEGPVMIFLTTTATDVDEELMNRCLVLTVDEGQAQSEAIHDLQREAHTLEGRIQKRQKARVLRRHRNAQRLLRPLVISNPYARKLTFQSHRTRSRRDHLKYLNLIAAIALLHQYQRELRTAWDGETEVTYIEATLSDIAKANALAHRVLGHSTDELPPQTRRFLRELQALVAARREAQGLELGEVRFTRRAVREWTGLAQSQVHVHLQRLEELEYVLVHAGRRGKSMVYELCYEGQTEEGEPFFPGLLDVTKLRAAEGGGEPGTTTAHLSESDPNLSESEGHSSDPKGHLSASLLGHFGPHSGPLRSEGESCESGSGCSSSSSLAAKKAASSPDARLGEPAAPARGNGDVHPSSDAPSSSGEPASSPQE